MSPVPVVNGLIGTVKETSLFRDNARRSDCIAGVGLLTVYHVRHITSSSSSRPASAENGYGAKLSESPARITLSRQNGLISAIHETTWTKTDGPLPARGSCTGSW